MNRYNIALALILFFGAFWILNAVKFFSCDFESNYKCEIIHGIGFFMPISAPVTVWFASDGP